MATSFNIEELALPAGLAVAAIFIFILILALTGKKQKVSKAVKALGTPEVTEATVFVQEGNNIVRRSTRCDVGMIRLVWLACSRPMRA